MRVGTVATPVPPAAVRSPWRTLVILALLAAVVFLVALLTGSSGIGLREALAALAGSGDEATRNVLIAVRLPRVLAAFGVGSLLALSGVLLQALFRNSLADPYVLGVSGGAAVGALLAMIAGAAAFVVQSAAVAGALGAVGLVYLLARGGGTPRLLLTGVVLASACGALVSVLLALADSSRVRGMVFWLAGDLEWAVQPWLSAGAALIAVAAAILLARPLNVLAAGELRARTVGLALEAWRTRPVHRVRHAHRHRGGERRHGRFRGTDHPARGAPGAAYQRPPPGGAGGGALRRHAARRRRPGGAHHRSSPAAAGGGDHGARRGAAVRGAAAPAPLVAGPGRRLQETMLGEVARRLRPALLAR